MKKEKKGDTKHSHYASYRQTDKSICRKPWLLKIFKIMEKIDK